MRSLNEETFDEALSQADGLVLVDFWAPWCGPCQMVTPTLDALSHKYEEGIEFYKVNVDEASRLMTAFQLKSVPTVLILKPHAGGARVLDAMVGAQPASRYEKWIDKYLHPKPNLFKRLISWLGRHKTADDTAKPA